MDMKPLTDKPMHKFTTLPINVRLSGLELKSMHWHAEIYESLLLLTAICKVSRAYGLLIGVNKRMRFHSKFQMFTTQGQISLVNYYEEIS